MKRSIAAVFIVSVQLAAAPLAALAADPSSSVDGVRPGRATPTHVLMPRGSYTLPARLDPNKSVKVIVTFADPSVASMEGDRVDAGGGRFTSIDRAVKRTALRQAQDTRIKGIRGLGGRILDRHVDALNSATVIVKASAVDALRLLPGVATVSYPRTYTRDNDNSDTFTGAKAVWTDLGYTGAGVKVAILDTGVDYTHADFGGAGTPGAFEANDPTIIEPGTFPTAKVVNGYDFVGDAYDADHAATSTPAPDPDPLDCEGHGSHVSGTAVGDGVDASGATYHGPYDASVDFSQFKVAPGAAPEASLMLYKVFGCTGSVDNDIIIAALDRAVADGADVISMSLGSVWGRADDPDAQAADNAVRSGVPVIVSAGNSGHTAYMVGGPATGKRVLAVAAVDGTPTTIVASITSTSPAATIAAVNANAAPANVTGILHVVPGPTPGSISLGCTAADYDADSVGKIVVVARGTCGRVEKPAAAEAFGAIGTIMVNNTDGLPPFEGTIDGVTTPFFGVAASAAPDLFALEGATVTLDHGVVGPNPALGGAASFTSGGPRSGDSGQKPDVAAPGVSVSSVLVGSGDGATLLSGTSMAAPQTAGVAALVRQAHPSWSADQVKAALMNTTTHDIPGFDPRLYGSGWLSAPSAIKTTVLATTRGGEDALNFGILQEQSNVSVIREFELTNTSRTAETYDLSVLASNDQAGIAVTIDGPSTVRVPARGRVDVRVRLRATKADLAALPFSFEPVDILTINGLIVATPRSAHPTLSVPYIATPHGRSDVDASGVARNDTFKVTNHGLHAGWADVYAWLVADGRDRDNRADSRGIGIQYFPDVDPNDSFMVFAFAQGAGFSNPTEDDFETYIDIDGDGAPDVNVFAADFGLVTTGDPTGQLEEFQLDLNTGDFFDNGPVFAPFGGAIMEMPIYASYLGLSADGIRTATLVQAYVTNVTNNDTDVIGSADLVTAPPVAEISPWDSQVETGQYADLAPGESVVLSAASRALVANEPSVLGWMVVSPDDATGRAQSDLVRLPYGHH